MSVTLWLDTPADEAVELGPTLPTYLAFAELGRAAGPAWRDDYPDLSGVLTQCETQEDADPAWLAGVRAQAAALLRRHGPELSDAAHRLAATLAHAGGGDVREERDDKGHDHAADGKFTGPGGGGGGAARHPKANAALPDAARPGLDAAEAKAVKNYAGPYHRELNRALRAGRQPAGLFGEIHAGLRAAFARAEPFAEPVTVRRGLAFADPGDAAAFVAAMRAARGKGLVRLAGYSSTTTRDRQSWGDVELVIRARKGLDAGPHATFDEAELILDHDSAVRVTGVARQGRKWVIEMDHVLDGGERAGGPPAATESASASADAGADADRDRIVETLAPGEWREAFRPEGGGE